MQDFTGAHRNLPQPVGVAERFHRSSASFGCLVEDDALALRVMRVRGQEAIEFAFIQIKADGGGMQEGHRQAVVKRSYL